MAAFFVKMEVFLRKDGSVFYQLIRAFQALISIYYRLISVFQALINDYQAVKNIY